VTDRTEPAGTPRRPLVPSPRPSARRFVGGMAVALALVVLAAACGSSSPKASGSSGGTTIPVNGGQMVVAVGAETNGWNPHQDEWAQAGALVGSSVLEPLATTGHDLSAKPWLATSWTPNATFDTWTITLRTGVTFQDGEPFDAAAVKQNLDDASTAALSGEALAGLFKQVSVVDDHTVQVTLTQPWAAFPSSFLDGQSAMMMAPKMLAASGGGQTHPIGTGPFTFVSWQPGGSFVTTRNPTYWQKGLPHLAGLTFKVLTDPTTQASSLQSGDVDMAFTSSAQVANQLTGQFTELRDWSTEPGMAMVNTLAQANGKPNPMANLHARLALAYATNRTAIAAQVGQGVQSGNSPFPATSPWGMPQSQNGYPTYDLAKARQQVAQYEQQTGQSSLELILTGTPDSGTQQLMQILQAQWKQAGIKASLQGVDQATFITQVVSGHYQVAMFTIYSSPDPDQNHYFWSAATAAPEGQVAINFTRYTTPKMEADLKVGRQSPVFATRKAAYDDLVRQLNTAAVNIWTFSTPYSLIAAHDVHGLPSGPTAAPFGNFQPKTFLADLWMSR
jgi:peptide/nickel transport system substrate-binding protein